MVAQDLRIPTTILLLILSGVTGFTGNAGVVAFVSVGSKPHYSRKHTTTATSSSAPGSDTSSSISDAAATVNTSPSSLTELLTARLPTSVEDQVRQAAASVQRASRHDGIHRQTVRLLLPLIGATELDDWPGGSRQQMEAAEPLVRTILETVASAADAAAAADDVNSGGSSFTTSSRSSSSSSSSSIQKVLLDASEGVSALLVQATKARDDACAVLLPTAETVTATTASSLYSLDEQVGPSRTLFLVNPQWRRRSDFGQSIFGTDDRAADYAETFVPTFSLTSLICEGESIRVLRTYPGPWRVFLRQENGSAAAAVEWNQVGSKNVVETKPTDWQRQPANQRDGGILFNYGQPTYHEIVEMLQTSNDYTPKSPAERAAAAFNFIKDTL